MTIALLGALVAVNIAYLVFIDRKDTRDRHERDSDREERQVLLQRIQAPQAAVYEHHATVSPPGMPEATSLPMSDEEIAEIQNRHAPDGASELAAIIARMEAAENGTAQIQDGLIP